MKKTCFILCLAVFACCMFSGCAFIYQQTILGDWAIDRYYENGTDKTSDYVTYTKKDYKITFYDNGDFTETYKTGFLIYIDVTVTGIWSIETKPDGKPGEFQLKLAADSGVRIYDIKEISKETIDISRAVDSDHTERIILEPVPEA
jgi:hypothetical protein